jgi:hypothetical protein
MSETTGRFQWFWAWQEERETAWLEQMSREGWHLEAYAFGWYRFRRGEPRECLYRLDFDPGAAKRSDEYLGIFRDAGWEHVLRWGSWHYFRAERGNVFSEEIYTDRESRIAKYRRLLAVIAVCMITPAVSLGPAWAGAADRAGGIFVALQVLRLLLLCFGIYAVVRLLSLIGRLRR